MCLNKISSRLPLCPPALVFEANMGDFHVCMGSNKELDDLFMGCVFLVHLALLLGSLFANVMCG